MHTFNILYTLLLLILVTGCSTSEKSAVATVPLDPKAPIIKPPSVDQKKIKEGWLFGRYPKADSGPYFTGNLENVIDKALKENKCVVVSIGRDACPLTTRFYHYVESGLVPLDMNRYVYVKLDIDNYEQQEAFCQHFMVEGNLLPFIGVITKEGIASELHYGYGTSDDFAEFIKEKSE